MCFETIKICIADELTMSNMDRCNSFLSNLIGDFFSLIDYLDQSLKIDPDTFSNTKDTSSNIDYIIKYCERFLRLLINLESQLPTRRYVHQIIKDHLILSFTSRSLFYQSPHAM